VKEVRTQSHHPETEGWKRELVLATSRMLQTICNLICNKTGQGSPNPVSPIEKSYFKPLYLILWVHEHRDIFCNASLQSQVHIATSKKAHKVSERDEELKTRRIGRQKPEKHPQSSGRFHCGPREREKKLSEFKGKRQSNSRKEGKLTKKVQKTEG
jgi:hypothetical protein